MSSFRRAGGASSSGRAVPPAAPSTAPAATNTAASATASQPAVATIVPGTRKWLDGALLVSSGLAQVDSIFGGGLPLGSLLLLEEDAKNVHARTMAQLFMAEGVACGHRVLLAGADGRHTPSSLLASLPMNVSRGSPDLEAAGLSPAEKAALESAGQEAEGQGQDWDTSGKGLSIAWQYRKYLPGAGADAAATPPSDAPAPSAAPSAASPPQPVDARLTSQHSTTPAAAPALPSSATTAPPTLPSAPSSAPASGSTVSASANKFCHTFDLNRRIPQSVLARADVRVVPCVDADPHAHSRGQGGDDRRSVMSTALRLIEASLTGQPDFAGLQSVAELQQLTVFRAFLKQRQEAAPADRVYASLLTRLRGALTGTDAAAAAAPTVAAPSHPPLVTSTPAAAAATRRGSSSGLPVASTPAASTASSAATGAATGSPARRSSGAGLQVASPVIGSVTSHVAPAHVPAHAPVAASLTASSSSGTVDRVTRVCLQGVGGPLWPGFTGPALSSNDASTSGLPNDATLLAHRPLLSFLRQLRKLVEESPGTILLVTMPTFCLPHTVAAHVRSCFDSVIKVHAFGDPAYALATSRAAASTASAAAAAGTSPEFADYTGLLLLRRLPRLAAVAASAMPDTLTYVFKRDRRKMVVEKPHLPPEADDKSTIDSVTARSSATATAAAAASPTTSILKISSPAASPVSTVSISSAATASPASSPAMQRTQALLQSNGSGSGGAATANRGTGGLSLGDDEDSFSGSFVEPGGGRGGLRGLLSMDEEEALLTDAAARQQRTAAPGAAQARKPPLQPGMGCAPGPRGKSNPLDF